MLQWKYPFPRLKVMHIHKKDRISKTTDEEIKDMGFKNVCDRCSRDFPTKRGLSIHKGRWCDDGKTKRSRLSSLADKAVKQKKRKLSANTCCSTTATA